MHDCVENRVGVDTWHGSTSVLISEDQDDNDDERWIGEKVGWGLIFLFLWGWGGAVCKGSSCNRLWGLLTNEGRAPTSWFMSVAILNSEGISLRGTDRYTRRGKLTKDEEEKRNDQHHHSPIVLLFQLLILLNKRHLSVRELPNLKLFLASVNQSRLH